MVKFPTRQKTYPHPMLDWRVVVHRAIRGGAPDTPRERSARAFPTRVSKRINPELAIGVGFAGTHSHARCVTVHPRATVQ
jgi:hypothetical protein